MLSGFAISGGPLSGLGDGALLTLRRLGPGRNPRLVLDFDGGCLRQELHLFHFLDAGGLRRRSESGQFNTPEPTVEPDDAELQLEDAFRSTDRRVSLVYSEREPIGGTYALKRTDSTEYPPFVDPPQAPHFTLNNPAFIPFYRGSWWNDPQVNAVVTAESIQLVVQAGTVHAVELECSNLFPAGYEPDIWHEQVQEYTLGGAVIPTGSTVGFAITLAHGDNVMQPCAYRARCRDDSDPVHPCYSPWRYYLAGYYDPTPLAVQSYVLSGSDAGVCAPPGFGWAAGGRPVSFVYESKFVGIALGAACFIAYGFTPSSPFLVVHHWNIIGRAYMGVSFQDETGKRFQTVLRSIESVGAAEGTSPPASPPDQSPLDFE